MGEPQLQWQTWWAWLSGGLACAFALLICVFALLLYHHLRLRQLTRQFTARFDERLAERTRIAQDLHDTLLQDFLGVSMQLYVAVEQLPEELRATSRLNHIQQRMGQVIEEARNMLQGLRSLTVDSLDLEQAFARIPREYAGQSGTGEQVRFHVTVEGKVKPLHPLIRDEVYRIGREAVIHALRQSGTTSVEVELRYSIRQLRIFVRNDGGTVEAGSERPTAPAHLRERAERIGARLKVQNLAAGTEVALTIPSQVAFLSQAPSRLPSWMAGLSPRRLLARWLKTETRRQ